MRWPWVSRDTAEAQVNAVQDRLREMALQYQACGDLLAAKSSEVVEMHGHLATAKAEAVGAQAERDTWKHYAEQADAKFTALWEKYLEATAPRAAVVRETVRTPEQAVRAHEQLFVNKLAADLRGKGVPGPMAEAEAARIRRELTPHA